MPLFYVSDIMYCFQMRNHFWSVVDIASVYRKKLSFAMCERLMNFSKNERILGGIMMVLN